jgi:hypothetical protein
MTRSPRYHSRAMGLLLVSVLATAACGSTVQSTGTSTLAGGAGPLDASAPVGGDGLGAPGGLTPDGSGVPGAPGAGTSTAPQGGGAFGGGGAVGGSAPGGAQGGPAGPAQAPGAGSAGGSAPAAGSGAVGPGVTAKSIAIGIPFCNDCASGNAALGAGGEDPGDTRRYYRAAIDDVNARGGVLGRKLVPVFHEVSVSDNIDASAQAACETFTKDNKVLIMNFRGDLSYECAKKAGILVGGSGGTGPVYEKYPNLFAPASIRLERLFEVTVKAMDRSGWHKPDAAWPTGKIGLITWDNNEYRYAMKNGYLKGLAAVSLEETDVRYIAVPQSANALADASASISNAVLAFRQQGIDHVYIGDGPAGIFAGAGLTLLFLQNAKSQNYYPRYGFNSNNSPNFKSHPQDQLVGMLAIDSIDVERANDEGIALNPVRERCFGVMQKKGLRVGQRQTQILAANACEMAWFAEAVLKRATAGTTLPSMVAAAESLGTSYRSPLSYGNRIGPGQHDGTALFRGLRYDEACSCNRYTSKPFEP